MNLRKMTRFILPFCMCLLFAPFYLHSSESLLTQKPPTSQATSTSDPVVVKLISDDMTIQPGHTFLVAVDLKMADGWDTYWLNPGDAGFPTKIEWHLPEGFKASNIKWPYPERFISQSLVGYGYTEHVLLLTEITAPENLDVTKPVVLNADVSWLACKEQCVPGNAKVSLTMDVKNQTPQKDPLIAAQFSDAKIHLPQSLGKEEGTLTVGALDKEIVFKFKPATGNFKNVIDAVFIPAENEVIDHSAPQQLQKGNEEYTLSLKRAHPEGAMPDHVKGVFLVSEKGSAIKKAIAVDEPIGKVTSATGSSHHEGINFKVALLFAFVGGLILNVMPCVLPVIALKIFSFVKMGQENRSTILKHGGVFAFGVLVSFWVLSALLLILRATGEGIGWGFQLQEPVFVTVLVVVLFVLSLSLFGLFELGTSLIALGNKNSQSNALKGSFFSGVLATLVATPCTGPLLGPALGFAMTLPPISALSIFTMMGIGMASPYLLFSAFPKMVRFLPKPGNWMVVFKQLMGFLMLATCLWLIWVLSSQTTTLATFVLLAALLLIALAGWIYGHFATPLKKKMTRYGATALAALIVAVSGTVAIKAVREQSQVSKTEVVSNSNEWQAYSPVKVEEMRKEGKAVFVDFTAKWCLICQANKATLRSADVQKAFEDKGVVTMSADWTKRDEMITESLKKLGRSGVPVYVLYPADPSKPPLILPQTLTKSVMADYLSQINEKTDVIVGQ